MNTAREHFPFHQLEVPFQRVTIIFIDIGCNVVVEAERHSRGGGDNAYAEENRGHFSWHGSSTAFTF